MEQAEGYFADAESSKNDVVYIVTNVAQNIEDLTMLRAFLPLVEGENDDCNDAVDNL